MKNTTAKTSANAKDDAEIQHCIADLNEDLKDFLNNEGLSHLILKPFDTSTAKSKTNRSFASLWSKVSTL